MRQIGNAVPSIAYEIISRGIIAALRDADARARCAQARADAARDSAIDLTGQLYEDDRDSDVEMLPVG